MSNFTKKPVEIEAITFDEFIKYGKESGANIVNGMPWSIAYKGHHISHENDECYLIPTLGGTVKFTPDDMLITGVQGEVCPCKISIFNETYDLKVGGLEGKPGTYQKRVVSEKEELDKKIIALDSFIGTKTFNALGKTEQALLADQWHVMKSYSAVLSLRIKGF